MKKYILPIIFIFSFNCGFTQNEFKELFESLSVNDRFSNMINLRHYQSKYPDHAITYFLSGDIYYQYLRETNPIFLFDFIELNNRELITNYNLAKFKLDEKQVRQDREYYGNIEIVTDKKKVGLPDILNAIEIRLEEAAEYYKNAKGVHDNYYQCIGKYNECLFKYREILDGFPYYKDLYLLADESLKKDITNLALNFDSSLVFFNAYKVSCAKLSHILKVNDYKLNPIITYRLEGLIEAVFTLPLVELWDFKSWAKSFLLVLDGDIKNIREGLTECDYRLDRQVEKLKIEDIYNDELEYYKAEDKFKNLIGKYDYASICIELLEYKNSKVKYLVKTREEVNNPKDSADIYLINRLKYFKDLAFMKEELNHEADTLKKLITIDDIGKNFNFFEERYRGLDGFKRWCEVEKYDNDRIFIKNLFNLKNFFEKENSRFAYVDSVTTWKKRKLAFGIQNTDLLSLRKDTLITTHFNKFKKKNHFLSGFEITKDSIFRSFTARLDENGVVSWLNSQMIQSEDTIRKIIPVFQQPLDDSTVVVVDNMLTGRMGVEKGSNYISKYNWQGKLVFSKKTETGDFPRFFYVDEINEQLLLITKGLKKDNGSSIRDTLTVCLADYSGNIVWKKKYLLQGSFIDVVFTNSNFYITCNYKEFSDLNGVNLKPEDNNQNMLGIYITREGKTREIHQYNMKESMNCMLCKKVTSSHINLVGEKINENNKGEQEMFYILVDPDGKLVYSTEELIIHANVIEH